MCTLRTHTSTLKQKGRNCKRNAESLWVLCIPFIHILIYITHKLITFGKVINECLERVTTIDATEEEKKLGGSWVFVHLLAHFEWRQKNEKMNKNTEQCKTKTEMKQRREKIRPTEQNRAAHKVYGPWMIYYCILWKFLHSSLVCVCTQYTSTHSTAIKWLCFLCSVWDSVCVYVHYPDVYVFVGFYVGACGCVCVRACI